MQKKKIGLVFIVVLIWIIVGFRFFKTFHKTNVTVNNEIETPIFNISLESDQIKKQISKYERDPFLGVFKKKGSEKKIVARDNVNWPLIEYVGSVKNLNKNSKLYFIRLNNRLMQWRVSHEYNNVKFLKASEFKIEVMYAGEKKIIYKNEKN